MTAKTVLPLTETGDMGGVGHLQVNQDGIVDGIAVKAGHGTEIVEVFFALEQLLYAVLNSGDDLLDAFFISFFVGNFCFGHKKTLLSKMILTSFIGEILIRGFDGDMIIVFKARNGI